MNMLKFLRGSGQPSPNKRQPAIKQPPEKQPELFAFRKTVQHGFPHKPTALAYDPIDSLMAIGTHSGAIKVFGRPGVEFYGQHLSASNTAADCTVQLLEFVAGSGRLLSLTTANQLILWEPAGAMLVPIKTISFDGKLKKVSSICCSSAKDVVWIGTEGGNVYQFDLQHFAIKEPVIYHDVVLEQVPATYKLNPGAIESVRQLPDNPAQLLIAYNRGLCVLWDLEANAVARAFISPGHGQSVGLHISADAEHFTWYHADGSYATWHLLDAAQPIHASRVPYGPDPCKSINSLVRSRRGEHELIIFAGGMPRSAYGDHQCVSVHCADGSKTCLDFTSKVIDFFVAHAEDDVQQAEVLVVLLEEELCAFDLRDAALQTVRLPYLHSVHVSAVTCNHLQSQVTAAVYEKIAEAGAAQLAEQQHSSLDWPIRGGRLGRGGEAAAAAAETDETLTPREYEILLTGHEDGSVKFWDCSGVILQPLLHMRTAPLFGSADVHSDLSASQDELDESEPPFRKAGFFDPYSDDPRFAIKKVALCARTGQVIVAGTAGQIVVAGLDHLVGEGPLRVSTVNLVSCEGFVWKGHDQLTVRKQLLDEEVPPVADGLQVVGVLQVMPPAAINALALQSAWNLLAAGTAHGLVIFDYVQHHVVQHVCTLNPKDLSGSGEVLSRRKSFKKTLRESFRRLRRSRSTRTASGVPTAPVIETRPMERQIEARSTEDAATSMVRCLTFAQTHMFKNQPHKTYPSLWFGTYAYVCAYILYIPPKTPSANTAPGTIPPILHTRADKGKEITFKQHKAPIIGITVFDVHTGLPLELAPEADTFARSAHRVVIATEEQFKVFSLPELSVKDKYKLTAKEGVRIRRMSFARFSCTMSVSAPPAKGGARAVAAAVAAAPAEGGDAVAAIPTSIALHHEVGMLCLTNAGDCIIFSVPDLKKKLNAAAVRREDINGISSLCFTNFAEALYMMSSSELQRVSLAANKVVALEGALDLQPLNEPESATDEQRSLVHRHDNDDEDDDDDDDDEDNKSELMDATLATVTSRGGPSGDQLAAVAKAIGPASAANGGAAAATKSIGGSALDVTTTSSMGDMTLDSIRDHLNSSTITTLHKQTTEEVVGRLAVLSTQTNQSTTVLKMSEIGDNINLPNFKDLSSMGETTETSTSSVVIKSVITSVTTNGDSAHHEDEHHHHQEETTTTTTSTKSGSAANENGVDDVVDEDVEMPEKPPATEELEDEVDGGNGITTNGEQFEEVAVAVAAATVEDEETGVADDEQASESPENASKRQQQKQTTTSTSSQQNHSTKKSSAKKVLATSSKTITISQF